MKEKLITIGKLSRISGVSTRTIRHYEDIGLLRCAGNTEAKYRLYSESEIKKLELILLFKGLGFSLEDIQAIVSANDNQTIVDLFSRQERALEYKMSQLSRHKEILSAVVNIYKTQGLEYINNYRLLKEMLYVNSVAAKIFNGLSLKLQIKVLKELYRTGTLSPELIKEIGTDSGQRLLNELHMLLVKTLILKVDAETEKNIMEALEAEDPEFADRTKAAMFTFDDIIVLDDRSIQKWLCKCKDEELAAALQDSGSNLRERLYGNMPVERANGLKERMARVYEGSMDKVFTARNNLINTLREMEGAGEVVIERFGE